MRKILGIIKPFDMTQTLYVYEDNNKIAYEQPKMNELNDAIFGLMQEYDVTQVDLVGSKQFNRGLGKRLKEAEKTKFNTNTLEVNIL